MKPLPKERIWLMACAALVALVLIVVLLTRSFGGAKGTSSVTSANVLATSTSLPRPAVTPTMLGTGTATVVPTPTLVPIVGSPPATATPMAVPPTPTPQPIGTPTPDTRPPNLVVSPINAQVTCGTPTTVGKYPPLVLRNEGGGIAHWDIWVLTYGQGFDLNYPVVASMYNSGIKADQEQIVTITQAQTKTSQAERPASPTIGIGPARVIIQIIGAQYSVNNPVTVNYYCTNLH